MHPELTCPGGQRLCVLLLVGDGPAGDNDLRVRGGRLSVFTLQHAHGVEEDVHALPGVDPPDVADNKGVVGQSEGPACATRSAWEELGRVSFLMYDHDVAGVELGSHRGRNGEYALCEVACQEAFEAQGRT